ncbi:unnamed protein product [Vitrella brassicaformis CCMP3155]|uniref:riboflavin kinase n=2 Tax=Vitrella brassicaformis TaxID=1169539 RepID=A0A0G4G469_VITBC|nr:unnamed protein product [Vitrella brassicaformis CCMP3155]|eukprot:CEM22692.1 unnamed protein product [Vitrella brassicaformis CCMP3155]
MPLVAIALAVTHTSTATHPVHSIGLAHHHRSLLQLTSTRSPHSPPQRSVRCFAHPNDETAATGGDTPASPPPPPQPTPPSAAPPSNDKLPDAAKGLVQGGKRLGRTIGFPTLNIRWSPPEESRPRYGVYAVRVTRLDQHGTPGNEGHPGVANYGLRPTVNEADPEPLLEVHLLDVDETDLGDGVTIIVQWLKFLRPEQKFSGVEALKAQLQMDEQAAKAFFGL